MPATFHFTTYVYRGRNEREFPVEVSYRVVPYVPARLYGDYPQPAEGGEIEIVSAELIGGSYPLTDDEMDGIQDECEARADNDLADYFADAADYRAELRADDLLFGGLAA